MKFILLGEKLEGAIKEASIKNNLSRLKFLLKFANFIGKPTHENTLKECLVFASYEGNYSIVKYLLDAQATPPVDEAVYGASVEGNEKILKLLLFFGGNPKTPRAFHMAASKGHLEVVLLLLIAGCDPERPNTLAVARRRGHLKVVELLLKADSIKNVQTH